MARLHTNRPSRQGIASLELVMAFPLLLALVSGLFLVARASVARLGMATAARQQTWQQRDAAPAGSPLSLIPHAEDSEVASGPQVAINMPPYLPGQPQQARSRNTVVGNSWGAGTQQEAIPMSSAAQNGWPHTSAIDLVVPGFSVWSSPFLEANDPTNPAMWATRQAGAALNGPLQFDGWLLEYVYGSMFGAEVDVLQWTLDAANDTGIGGLINGIGSLFGDGDVTGQLQDAINQLNDAINVFHNLNQASHGK